MLLNGTLFNSEAWQGISQAEIDMLEKVDEDLMRGLLQAHSKIPTEALFLEIGTIPIRYTLKSRRLSYLHTILSKDSDELIKEVYEAQKNDPIKGDFYQLIMEDFNEVGLSLTETEITSMKKEHYQKNVKVKVRQAALRYLKENQQRHSKVRDIKYPKFELSQYMESPLFDSRNIQTLLALRTRTVRGIRNDFSGMYDDLTCPLGCGDQDTLPNILTCSVLKDKLKTDTVATNHISYDDIFSSNDGKQKQVTELYSHLLGIREELLKSQPVALTGPVH